MMRRAREIAVAAMILAGLCVAPASAEKQPKTEGGPAKTDNLPVVESASKPDKEEAQAEQDAREVEKEPTEVERADAEINDCINLFDKGSYDSALVKANEAIGIVDTDADYFSMRGTCYLQLKQFPKALEDYTKAISLTVANARDYRNRGEVFVKMEKYSEAVADCSKAIQFNPLYGAAFWWRAQAEEKLGKTEEAAKDLDAAKASGYAGPANDTKRDQAGNGE